MIVLNNKCNLSRDEFIKYLDELSNIKVNELMVLCPIFINIGLINNNSNYLIGSQNISCDDKGAHTGEISGDVLKLFGVKYSIIEHSERRGNGESNLEINKKINKAFSNGITPILCIG